MSLLRGLIRDLKSDFKATRRIRLQKWYWVSLIIGGLAILLVLLAVGKFELADMALGCFAGIICSVAIKWKFRGCSWFWITIAIVAALHIPIVMLVRFPEAWESGPAIGPIFLVALPDVFVMLTIVDIVARLVTRRAHQKAHLR